MVIIGNMVDLSKFNTAANLPYELRIQRSTWAWSPLKTSAGIRVVNLALERRPCIKPAFRSSVKTGFTGFNHHSCEIALAGAPLDTPS